MAWEEPTGWIPAVQIMEKRHPGDRLRTLNIRQTNL